MTGRATAGDFDIGDDAAGLAGMAFIFEELAKTDGIFLMLGRSDVAAPDGACAPPRTVPDIVRCRPTDSLSRKTRGLVGKSRDNR